MNNTNMKKIAQKNCRKTFQLKPFFSHSRKLVLEFPYKIFVTALHDIFKNRVVGHEANFHERHFLEAWFSIRDPQSGNDHIAVPEVYKSLARA